MADEVSYSSVGDNKRKYEESTFSPPPPPRRPTGFSSPIAAVANPSAFELAKQKAQELASRFMNDAEAKRPKFDNGGGFDSAPASAPDQPSSFSHGSNASSAPSSYGYQSSSKKIEIPNTRVGVIIGKGGETIKYLQLQSGAKIQVTRDMDADPNSHSRMVELMGTSDQIVKAEQLIHEVLAEADTGGSAIVSRRVTGPTGADQFSMKIPNNKVGLVIGKGGETIKSIQARTGARVQVIPLHPPPGDTSNERTVQIDGSSDQIEAAKQIVNEVISEQRVRNSGGYSNQGYQARPPTNWTPPAQTQSGYGYSQPGSYPGQQQYNAPPQSQYPGYPPHQSSAGYPSNYWDPTSQQPPSQQPGYDYNQQQPPAGGAPPQNNSGYGYNQGYGAQGYSQDGYGGGAYQQPPAQQHGYGQLPPPPSNPNQGYDQNNYGNGANPPTDGTHPPAAAYGTQQGETGQSQSAAPQPSYTGQQSYEAQTGYAGYPPPQGQKVPAASNPPPYGPPSGQSPSSQGGSYGQAGGYSTSYSQPPQAATAQQPYGGGAPYAGAYPPPYGAPPAYGQHQVPAANQYGSGGGYPYHQAPSAYAVSDGNANPEAPAAAQTTQTTNGTEKSSPPELK